MIFKLKNIFFKILYLLLILYLVVFVPSLFGKKPLVVISGSMEPVLKVGGVLYYAEQNIDEFKKDDILVYQTKDHIISHRIVDIKEEGFITKGDANNNIDFNMVNNRQVLGKGTNWSIPYIGYYADYIYHHKYLLVISLSLIIIDLFCDKWIQKKRVVNNVERKE